MKADDCRCDWAQIGGSGCWGIEVTEPSCPKHGDPTWRDDEYRDPEEEDR